MAHKACVQMPGLPAAQGLYDPRDEHDACGVGFVVHVKGQRSHAIVRQALQVLINLLHRGACGCEANTGDGAGILIQMPDRFLRRETARLGIALPPERHYGAGFVFLPRDAALRAEIEALIERIVVEEGQQFLGWRDVPTDDAAVGPSAVAVEPVFRQVFIGRGPTDGDRRRRRRGFERKLYVIRKRVEHAVDAMALADRNAFYVPSLSSRTLIYKGMLKADQIAPMFPDLADPDVESALALVHQRFSTNTFPSWPLAHPYRFVAHNGEINTLRGNINWMQAREALLESDVLGDDLKKILPIIREGGSDTAIFDNVLEFLVMAGRSLPHAVLMMIPEPWQNHEGMSPELRAFYEYHSSLMEPWDGPASIAFTDGTVIGAVLDRNGLRPSRYYVTTDDLVIMASEVGVLDIRAGEDRHQGAAAPRAHPAHRHGEGADHRRRGDQARAGAGPAVWRVAAAEHDADRGPAGGAVPAAARPRDRPAAPARLRLHAGGSADRARTDGLGRRGADWIDGHGHAAGGAVGAAAAALRLLHAALRAGDQSAARRDPRGARHVDGIDDRAGGQPPEARPGVLPADQHHLPDHRQRPAGQAAAHRRCRVSARSRCRCSTGRRKRGSASSTRSRRSRSRRARPSRTARRF